MIRLFAAVLLLLWATEQAHAGFLVPLILAELAITLSATAVAAITFVVNVAAAYGLSYVAGKLLNKPEPGEPQAVGGVELDLRADAKIPQSLVFGRAATAGSLVYAATFGRAPGSGVYETIHNNELIEIIALADHPTLTLVKTFIEGQEVTLAAPSGDRGQEVTTDGYVTDSGTKLLALKFYDGTQVAADTFSVDRLGTAPNQPWTAAMVGTGVTYVRLHYVYKADKVAGRLRWKFVVDGIKLYDPRLDTTVGGSGSHLYTDLSTHEWTDNLAVILYNVLRGIYVLNSASVRQFFYGLENTTADQFPLDVWFAAMNECDVSMDIGGTATEAQYRVGGEVAVDIEPLEFVKAMVKSCGGRLVEVGGIYKLYLGAPGLSVATISDGDLRADQEDSFRPILGLQNRINYITGSYTAPEDGWVEKVAPDRSNATWETEDGRRLPADLAAPMVQSGRQIQQLMEQMLMRSRQQRKHVIPLGRGAFAIEPGDVIAWNSTRNGYTAKLFEVDDADYDQALSTTLSVTEVDPADYDWVSADQLTEVPGEIIILQPDPKTVVGFSATGVEWISEQGYKRPAIRLSWTVPSEDLDIEAVDWELRVKTNPTNITSGFILDVQAGFGVISAGVISLTEYEVRAKYRSSANYVSDWSLWISVTTPDTRMTQSELDAEIGGLLDQVEDQIPDYLAQLQDDLDELSSALNEQVSTLQETDGQLLISIGARYEENAASIIQVAQASADADSAQATLITGLDVRLTTTEGDVAGQAILISGLDTRVTATEDGLVVQGAAITAIEAELDLLNTDGLEAQAAALSGLAVLVSQQGNYLIAQAQSLTLVSSRVEDATAEGLIRVVSITTPNDALAAVEFQARATTGGAWASSGLRLVAYANADGTTYSEIWLIADSTKIGQPDESGGDPIQIVEIANRNGVPAVVIRGELYKDNVVGVDTLIEGAAATVMWRQDAADDVSRTWTAWNNGGLGEVAATVTAALDADGPLAIDFSALIDDNTVSAGTDTFILQLNGVEVYRERVRVAPADNFTNARFSYTIMSGAVTGTNTLTVLFLHGGLSGSNTSAFSKIQWRLVEYHKPATQAGGAVAAAITYRTAQSATSVDTLTLSTVPTGTAGPTRRVAAGVGYRSSVNNVTGVTIGGVVAERVAHKRSASMVAQLWAATVPSGTTADVIISASGNLTEISAAVWTITTMAEAIIDDATDVAEAGGSPLVAANLEIQNGGVVIAFAWGLNTSAFSGTWTGADAVTEAVEAAGADITRYGGYHFLTTESTIDDDFSFAHGASTSAHVVVAASWR